MGLHEGQREPGKYSLRAEECLHMGYQQTTEKAWKLFNLRKRIFQMSADVKFEETIFPGWS